MPELVGATTKQGVSAEHAELVDRFELQGIEALREVRRPLVDDFGRKPVCGKFRERSRHLLDRPRGKRRSVVVAALEGWEHQTALHAPQEYRRLRHAHAFGFDAC